eukprot:c17000_g1_i1.p1 GENE.c17000_g1_i1~~c17000_g1_i1.p1  ORF type:complete len:396 (-),score=75.70 c17000_g1_i1:26-1213(-)
MGRVTIDCFREMSLRVLFLVVAAALCSAEKLQGRAEAIPSDKCAAFVLQFDDERLFVFALSEDSVVWHKYQKPEGGWSTWRPLADRKKMGSGPKAVRYSNGTLQVFARGTDRKFYVSTMTSLNEWSDWSSPFGDLTFTSPPTPVVTSAGTCLVFGVAAETHTVWYTESTPITSGELTFSAWANLGGEATSSPAVLVDAEALAHVFIRGTNRALWHLSEVYTHPDAKKWGEWECLGGVLASSPKVPVSLTGANLVEIYARAADKALWHRSQSAQQNSQTVEWSSWTSLGGVLASGPSVALNDDGLGDVFARATDKAIYFKSQFEDENGEVRFTQWETLGGLFSSSPSVIVRSDGMIDIFARGVDKAIWHSHQIETNGTRVFSSWHSLGGHTRKYTC